MVISKLHVHMDEHEFCERALELLRKKVPSFVNIHSVSIDGGELGIAGCANKVGTHNFSIKFRIALASDGQAICFKLISADIANTWWVPLTDFAIVNKALSDSIQDLPGISYSKEQLSVEPSKLFVGFGIEFTAKASSLDFNKGIDLDFVC